MLNPKDKLIDVYLYTSHISDFVYQREDGTRYVHQKREGETYMELVQKESGWVTGEVIENENS